MRVANMMIGLPAIVNPIGSKSRNSWRLPSWKIQTSAPKLAVSERRVMITALIGIASDPKSRNRITAEARSVVPTAHGIRSFWALRKSSDTAAVPPIIVRVMPAVGSTARTRGTTAVPTGVVGRSGLTASSRTVLPRM
jgi:hypothetical protein